MHSLSAVCRYHCKRCNKCSTGFDHHCPYLNQWSSSSIYHKCADSFTVCSIGEENFVQFFFTLIFFTAFMFYTTALSLYTIAEAHNEGAKPSQHPKLSHCAIRHSLHRDSKAA